MTDEELIQSICNEYVVFPAVKRMQEVQKKLNDDSVKKQEIVHIDVFKQENIAMRKIIKQIPKYNNLIKAIKESELKVNGWVDDLLQIIDKEATKSIRMHTTSIDLRYLSVDSGDITCTICTQHKVPFVDLYAISDELSKHRIDHFYKGGDTIYIDLDDSGDNAVRIIRQDGIPILRMSRIDDNDQEVTAEVFDTVHITTLQAILDVLSEFTK